MAKINVSKEQMEAISSDLDMTSMIDVTFLLLIFFICGQKFKILENKLETYLPKDTGPSSSPPPDDRLPTEVKLKHTGADKKQVQIFLGTVQVASFEELLNRLKARHDTAEKRKDLACDIYGTDEVQWRWVVQAFDAAIGAGIEKVQFGVGKDNAGVKFEKPK